MMSEQFMITSNIFRPICHTDPPHVSNTDCQVSNSNAVNTAKIRYKWIIETGIRKEKAPRKPSAMDYTDQSSQISTSNVNAVAQGAFDQPTRRKWTNETGILNDESNNERAESKSYKKRWSFQEEEQVLKMRKNGLTCNQIAAHFPKLLPECVKSRIRRLQKKKRQPVESPPIVAPIVARAPEPTERQLPPFQNSLSYQPSMDQTENLFQEGQDETNPIHSKFPELSTIHGPDREPFVAFVF
jgi:hypothetical protein